MEKFLLIVILLFPLAGITKEINHSVSRQTTTKTLLVYDVTQENGKLRNYRNTGEHFSSGVDFSNIDLHGFAELKLSASAQFSASALPYILQHAKGTVYIIDLRQEPHGFINGKAFTRFSYRNQINIDKSSKQIDLEEHNLLLKLASYKHISLHKIKKTGGGHFQSVKKFAIKIKKIESEQAVVQRHGAKYKRFYVLDRCKPCDTQVDEFIDFVRSLPKDVWLHFHCRAGKGRTTTFMVMYDMIRNAKQVSFEDILSRNIELGGSILDDIPSAKESKWTTEPAINRYKFIQKFYDYVIDQNGYNKTSWREWSNSKS